MPLGKYNKKRNFKKTNEPKGEPEPVKTTGPLRFVVQKHQAKQLHYDFRIEVDGVLKSWAVPKGPPNKSNERHLAVMVEDHPYDYKDFEGTIPEGNYGAGTVMVWDEGTYYIPELPDGTKEVKDRSEIQTEINKALKKGAVKLFLQGKKLKGKYALVRFKRAGEKSWLMIKDKDEFEGKAFPNEDNSAKTGRTLTQIEKDSSE